MRRTLPAIVALTVLAFVWFRRSQSRPPVLDPTFSISSDDVSAVVGVHPNGVGEAGMSEESTSVPR